VMIPVIAIALSIIRHVFFPTSQIALSGTE
jgi:hypothetical protein